MTKSSLGLSRYRVVAGASAAAVVAGLLPALIGPATAATPLPTTTVNDPPVAPHALTAFPARDFVSEDGLTPGDTVVFEVTHSDARGGATIASKPFVVGDDGLAEVNHPGGACWDVATPNIVAGDTVRTIVTASASGTPIGTADVTHVQDIIAGRPTNPAPGVIELHGTAVSEAGTQFAAGAFDARLVAPGKVFARSGRRDLRAPGQGAISYDTPGSTTDFAWTARWTNLSPADVTTALGAEAMGAWLGRNAAAGTEGTIYETGAGIAAGPQAPCTAPKEKLPPLPGQDSIAPSVPTGLTAKVSDINTVTLTWTPATDNEGVTNYGVYRNGVPVFTVQNADATAPAPTTFVDRNVPPGDYTYTVDAADAIDNRSAESESASATAGSRGAVGQANNPPTHPFTIFPSRDMVDVEGLVDGQAARVEVIRGGKVVSDSTGLIPDETGLVEINHVGMYCWDGTTPDLRANDVVRATVYNSDGSVAWSDEAVTANVTAGTATVVNGVVTIHGTAAGHDGKPLPVDQLEQRLVSSSKNPFGVNGKRTIRADAGGAGQGTLAYDPIGPDNPLGIKWTATYEGLDATDQRLATQVESRVMWLGRQPLAGLELTIFEVGSADPPGPAGPDCVAPFEPIDTVAPTVPAGVTASAVPGTRDVEVAWDASSDATYVYGYRVYRDAKLIAAVAGDVTSYLDKGVPPGEHSYSVEAFDSASAHAGTGSGIDQVAAGLGKPYGNTSKPSAPVGVTSPDGQAPTVPADLAAVVTGPGTVDLSWTPSTDDAAVTGYRVYRDQEPPVDVPATVATDGKVHHEVTDLATGAHTFAVDALDAGRNASAKSAPVRVTVSAADTQAPTVPTDVAAVTPDVHGRDVKVTWSASTDDVDVAGYRVFRGTTQVAQVNGDTLTWTDAGLAPATYGYTVAAVDSAGNVSAQSTPVAEVVVANDPPRARHTVIGYPSRDFVEGDGYVGEGPVTVQVLRGGKVVAEAKNVQPDAAGLVEVNHAGPGCWDVNTPDLRAGDVVRIITAAGQADQTTVADVRTGRPIQSTPGTITVKGTAKAANGGQLPLDQLEQRLVAGRTGFSNGRRLLLTGTNGTIGYDSPTATTFTATFPGLSAADVAAALDSESVLNWLGRTPLANSELTIAENGVGVDGGPAAGACTAPLDPTAPQATFTPTSAAYGDQALASTSASRTYTLSNAGSAPVVLSNVYVGGAHPGDFTLAPFTATTLAQGESATVKVTFTPSAVGARSATLNFVDNAANTAFQTVTLTGNGVEASAPAPVTGVTRALDAAVAPASATDTTVPVRVSWTAPASGTVTGYKVQRRNGATGAFTDVAAVPADTTSAVVRVTPGTATTFQVAACNGAKCSSFVAAPAVTVTVAQETAATVKGTWTRSPATGTGAVAGSFGGQVSSSATAGSTASWKATTPATLSLVSTKGPDRGNAEVWVDGVRVGTVNLYASTVQPAQVAFTTGTLAAGRDHTVELRPLGTRAASSTGSRVDLDAFISLR